VDRFSSSRRVWRAGVKGAFVPNPILNDKQLEEARNGWAAPTPPSEGGAVWGPPGSTGTRPIDDGPVTPWRAGMMTVRGAMTATAVLFVLLLASATFGWMATDTAETVNGDLQVSFPPLAFIGTIVGFVAVIVCYFKPRLAKFLGPIYALGQGFFLGAISKVFETQWNGIVLQAAGATLAVFAVMLGLYHTKIIKVTDRFRKIVIFATLGVMALYLVSIVMSLFGAEIAFINDASLFGIAFSVFVCVLAAMNLALDFDFIDRGAKAGLSKDYEWVAAVGLIVTIVWLYLEILRLLAKLRQN
jgi:uncharacterized YccA/Bax inhibitor family protein